MRDFRDMGQLLGQFRVSAVTKDGIPVRRGGRAIGGKRIGRRGRFSGWGSGSPLGTGGSEPRPPIAPYDETCRSFTSNSTLVRAMYSLICGSTATSITVP